MAEKSKLSQSHIRYLLVMKKISDDGRPVRSVELASALGVKKPSVHTMLSTLEKMGLVKKEPYGTVLFTDRGADTAKRYSEFYACVSSLIGEHLSPESFDPCVICSLLGGMTEEHLEELCKSIRAASDRS